MTPHGTIIAGDCCEVMREMPAMSVDAIITDPPFAMPAQHYASRSDWSRRWADTSILRRWWEDVCGEMARVLRPNGAIAVFTNHEAYSVFYPPIYERWPVMGCLVWDKGRPGMGRTWRKSHELIIVGRHTSSWDPVDGLMRTDVLSFTPTRPEDRIHPVQKPVPLLRSLVESMVHPGGIVLDPFAGSGTTLVAALACDRKAIGIDLDETYVDLANRHLSDLLTQSGQMEMDAS